MLGFRLLQLALQLLLQNPAAQVSPGLHKFIHARFCSMRGGGKELQLAQMLLDQRV